MSLTINLPGKSIASNLPPILPSVPTLTPQTPLEALTASEHEKEYSMWRTVVRTFAKLRKLDIVQLTFEALVHGKPWFKHELLKWHYEDNAARSYCNYLSRFIAHAKTMGWSPANSEIAEAWKEILAVMPKKCHRHIAYAMGAEITPAGFSDSVLDASAEEMYECGRSYQTTISSMNLFRRVLAKSGLYYKFPRLSPPSKKHAQFPPCVLPLQLQAELDYVLQQKQKQYAPGRGKRIRPITAANTRREFDRFISYAINLAGRKDICSMPQLFEEELVIGYISYLINERGLEPYSVCSQFRKMHAAFKCHPEYQAQHFGWLSTVIAECNQESAASIREGIRERKLRKYQDYERLLGMLDQMNLEMKEAEKLGGLEAAWLAHDRLVIAWWLILVWRQKNIRECELDKNVFRAVIPQFVDITRPHWVGAEEPVWQIRFTANETKTNHQIRSVLPRRLAALLEEYLHKYRPLLVRSSNPPKTLFLNRKGGPMTSSQFNYLISTLTLKYAQRRVTPHMIRDIFAYWWLKHYPADYLTLSKMLWHSNLQTTINSYASKFDESAALCRVEEFFDRVDEKFGLHGEAKSDNHSQPGDPNTAIKTAKTGITFQKAA